MFGFIAEPRTHVFLKPMVTKYAAEAYSYDLTYRSEPEWETYESLLTFARVIRRDLADWRSRDMTDSESRVRTLEELRDSRGEGHWRPNRTLGSSVAGRG